jgi:hypothetical protein
MGIKEGYSWSGMCLRRSRSQWKIAGVCWEEVLVVGIRVDERGAGEISQTNLWDWDGGMRKRKEKMRWLQGQSLFAVSSEWVD